MSKRPLSAAVLGLTCLAYAHTTRGHELLSGSVVTADALADKLQLCPTGRGYPAEFGWGDAATYRQVSATSGTPHIEQWRAGRHIATYTSFANRPGCTLAGDGTDYLNPEPAAASGCGPFTREHTWRLWAPGDTFKVFPAVYTGQYNQPWFGAQYDDPADYNAGISHTPDNVVIQGMVQSNIRPVIVLAGGASNNTLGQAPVYFDVSTGMSVDSLDVQAGDAAQVGMAGVYIAGASNLTLSNMRVSGFMKSGKNGVFSAGVSSGYLNLTGLTLDHNGGPDGPAHNAYINASTIDPNFTLNVTGTWSHAAFYGHLFKTRAQFNNFTGNFFQGGVPQGGHTQAENYLLDVPNGGTLTVRNNIFVKNRSGPNANGIGLTFLLEGIVDARAQSVDVENNTFVTFAKTYDGIHPNYPMALLYPSVRPDSLDWPSSIPTRIIKNAYVGFCTPEFGSVLGYRGGISVIEGFAELGHKYALTNKFNANDADLAGMFSNYVPELGTQTYRGGLRTLAVIGAEN